MKRAHGHLLFALVAATFAAVTVAELAQLQHARRINGEIRTVQSRLAAAMPRPRRPDQRP